MSNAFTPGPVETLARLAIQSERYAKDEEFRLAVDAVIGHPVFDAAPELLAALNAMLTHMGMDEDDWNKPTFVQARAAIAKATGEAA